MACACGNLMSHEPEVVLVTGGAGAIGSNLVRALRRDGRRVVVLDDLSSGHFPPPDDVLSRFVRGSVEDERALDAAFSEPVGVVFHLAALFANQNSVDHPERDLRVNGLGTLQLLERARRAHLRRFVYVSSSCVYAPTDDLLVEDSRLAPETPYACSKLLGEQYATFFRKHHGLPAVSCRLFNVFGPGEIPGRYRNVIPNFFARARKDEDLVVTGEGQEGRTFTYVDDVVHALQLAGGPLLPRAAVYNVASDNYCTIDELAMRVVSLTGSRSRIVKTAGRSWDRVRERRASWELARCDLGYRPRVALEDGLRQTLKWLDQVFFPVASSEGKETRGPFPGQWP
jgi:nucleoside-diphosphate-sugar epimerase